MKYLTSALLLVLSCAPLHLLADDSLLPNGGFESGITNWSIFIPDESKDKNCRFDVVSDSPHSGTNCARLQSDDFARFAVGPGLLPVQPGEHYHVSVWIRADAAAQVRQGAPGFSIRLALRQGNGEAEGGHLFIGTGNRVTRNVPADPATPLPKEWTQIEAVIEIPPGVDTIGPALFAWWTTGTIFVDDFTIQKVDAATPANPLWQKTARFAPASGTVALAETASGVK